MRCPVHLSIGQEYWLPFIDKHNKRGNRFFSTHRSHSLYMALNCDIKELIAELHGHEDGCLHGKGGSMHLKQPSMGLEASIPIVGSSMGLALGSALAQNMQGEDNSTIVYFGDGACEEGIFHESLNIASTMQLPILFICENNKYSCNTKLSRRQSGENMIRFAKSHGLKSSKICYNDKLRHIDEKIGVAFHESYSNAYFLEIESNRIYEHCGDKIDYDKGDRNYKTQKELKENDRITKLMSNNNRYLSYYNNVYEEISKIIKHYRTDNEGIINA